MKQTITQWLFMQFGTHPLPSGEYDWGKEETWQPAIYRFKPDDDAERIFLRTIEIEVDVPEDFDPTARQIAALEDKKRKAYEAYHGLVQEINQQISKLQAITYEPEAA